MPAPRIAKPFRRRLPAVLTAADWRRIAAAPSYRGPRAGDVLHPPPFDPPGPPALPAEGRRLLDAVLADPDADEPRLRFADWCDREGDPRGAFIRGQIEEFRRRFPQKNADQQQNDLFSDLRSSAEICGRILPTFAPWSAADFVVRRGFVEGLSLSGRAFVTLGEPLFRMTPLRDVRLVAVAWYVDELARAPHLANVERLDLSGNHVGPAGVRELAGSPFLGRLTGLNLSHNSLGRDGVPELLRAPWRGRLRELALAGNDLGREAVGELLADPALAGLTDLDLADNGLADLPVDWPRLRRLSLARNPINPAALARVAHLDSLRALDLRFCRLGPAGADVLADADSLRRLDHLDLGFNDLDDAGAEAIAGSEVLSRVRRLVLRSNRIGPAGAAALAASRHAGRVADLDVMTNRLGDTGAFALVAGDAFAGLERLDAANNGLTDAGVRRLVASGALGGLTALSLAWNPVGDAGVRALAGCPELAGLRVLDLAGTRIGFAGAKALAESVNLPRLRRLVVGETERLPADAVGLLRDRFGTTNDAPAWAVRSRPLATDH